MNIIHLKINRDHINRLKTLERGLTINMGKTIVNTKVVTTNSITTTKTKRSQAILNTMKKIMAMRKIEEEMTKKGIIIKTIIRTITRTTIKGIIRVIITNNKEVVIMKNLINNPSKNTTSLNKSKLFMLRSQILQTRLNNLINLIFY